MSRRHRHRYKGDEPDWRNDRDAFLANGFADEDYHVETASSTIKDLQRRLDGAELRAQCMHEAMTKSMRDRVARWRVRLYVGAGVVLGALIGALLRMFV